MKTGMKKVVTAAAVLVAVASFAMATVMPGPVAADPPGGNSNGLQGSEGQNGNQGGPNGNNNPHNNPN